MDIAKGEAIMTIPAETIVVSCSKDVAERISREIQTTSAGQSSMTARKNLDGDTAAWIVVASLSTQALPHVLSFIKDILGKDKVKKLKFRDWEVENPTPEMIDKFLASVEDDPPGKS